MLAISILSMAQLVAISAFCAVPSLAKGFFVISPSILTFVTLASPSGAARESGVAWDYLTLCKVCHSLL